MGRASSALGTITIATSTTTATICSQRRGASGSPVFRVRARRASARERGGRRAGADHAHASIALQAHPVSSAMLRFR